MRVFPVIVLFLLISAVFWLLSSLPLAAAATTPDPYYPDELYPRPAGPTPAVRERLATLGVNMQFHGETFTWSNYWSHVFLVETPRQDTYFKLVESLRESCAEVQAADFSQVNGERKGYEESIAAFLKDQLVQRCRYFAGYAKAITRQFITAAFSENLPQPLPSFSEADFFDTIIGRRSANESEPVLLNATSPDLLNDTFPSIAENEISPSSFNYHAC